MRSRQLKEVCSIELRPIYNGTQMAVEKGLSSDDQAVQATNDDATICKK